MNFHSPTMNLEFRVEYEWKKDICNGEIPLFEFQEAGINVFRSGEFIEQRTINGLDVSLISGGNGVEIIHHHLRKGKVWYIRPEVGWDGLEYLFVLTGELQCRTETGRTTLRANDSFSARSVKDMIEFSAVTDTDFLYVSSQPVFHNYSEIMCNFIGLTVAVEEKDGCTAEHCNRIRDLALMVGHQMELSPIEIANLHFGAFFHDLGKAKIPDHILGKPGKLTDEEFEEMKMHVIYGKEMIIDVAYPALLDACTIVEQHHERFNGSGYPNGLKGDEISIGAQIVAVVDSFDAIVSDRVYRKGQSKEYAINEIVKNRGILYAPDVVDSFLKIVHDIDYLYK